jgi:glyoxylase-like metal-dependent hydrolase (beta-lactamase superfamily II)
MVEPYTGHVTAGGLPAMHTAGNLRITKLSVGPLDNDSYVLECVRTGEQLLIDAANEADRLVPLAPRLATVVTTHQHYDHWQALADHRRAPARRRSVASAAEPSGRAR